MLDFTGRVVRIFIDTEFTSLLEPQLISLGMVAETGEEEYIEVEFDMTSCSDFVRAVVIGQLNRSPLARTLPNDLARRILDWLTNVRPGRGSVEICYDADVDWNLLLDAIGGKAPAWVSSRNVFYEVVPLLQANYFEQSSLTEHHALNDARAIAYAFRER